MISNSEYEQALKNEDNNNILEKVISKYRDTLDEDDLVHCKLISLWKALKAFDNSRQAKFTSFLYVVTDNYCKSMCKTNNKTVTLNIDLPSDTTPFYDMIDLDDLLEQIPEYSSFVVERYILGMTWDEIAKKNNCNRVYAMKQVNRGIEKMKRISL